ncbi:MAG: MoaD/ThiS family protein [bacterium]
MFKRRAAIRVTVRLSGGLDREVKVEDYEFSRGIPLVLREGARVKAVVKKLGLRNVSRILVVVNGQKVGLDHRLAEADEVLCLRPSVGG